MDNSIPSMHKLSTASSSSQATKESDAMATPFILDSDFFARYGIEPSSPNLDSPLPKRIQNRLFTDKEHKSSTGSEAEQQSDSTVNSGGSAMFSSPTEECNGVKDNKLPVSKDSTSPILPSSAVKLNSSFLPTLATAPRVTKRHLNTVPRRPIKLGPPARSLRHEQNNDNENEENDPTSLPSSSSSSVNEPDKRTSGNYGNYNTGTHAAVQCYDEYHSASINSEANVSHVTRMDSHSFSLPNHSVRSVDEHVNPSYRISTALSQSLREISDAIQASRPMSTSYVNTTTQSVNNQMESYSMESVLYTDGKRHSKDDILEKPTNGNMQHATSSYMPVSSYSNESIAQPEPITDDMSVIDQSNTGRTACMHNTTARTKGQSMVSRVPELERELSGLISISKLEMPSIKTSVSPPKVNTASLTTEPAPVSHVMVPSAATPVVTATATPTETNSGTHVNVETNTTAVGVAGNSSTYTINGRQFFRLGLLGKGGSSRVYKVMAPNNRIFAMKRVTLRKADKSTIQGYLNEIDLLKRLAKHECIINLFDCEHNKERKTITMLLECGETDLDSILKKKNGKPISINFILLYWEQMLQAVNAIHEEKIVHSDLKPANFLLVGGSLKLIDFGIAKAIGNDTTNIHRDQQIGTLNYMSPEALQDTNTAIPGQPHQQLMKLGRPSDVWSLGCILYQMTYGHTPFSHLNMLQKIQCIQNPNYEITYPTTTTALSSGQEALSVNPEFIRVIKSCLIRDPKRRATIPQLLADPILHRQGSSQATKPIYPQLTPSLMSIIVRRVADYSRRYPNLLNSSQGIDELSQGLLREFMQDHQRNLAAASSSSTNHGTQH